MKNLCKTICCAVLLSVGVLSQNAVADADFDAWKQQFYKQALKKGVSKKTLDKTVPKMQLVERLIEIDTKKPEFLASFYDYIKPRLSDTRIATGRKMKHHYKTWLSRVEEKYGVQREYLLALWGMETNYGTYMGNVDMLNSLASLAYHPRRRTFFTNELITYLKIVENEPSVAPKFGSWDGGFGNFQFMPTTFMAYAVDGDGNGRRDIVHNMPDAFSSAANYLSSMGWNKDEPWGREVILPPELNWDQVYENEKKTVGEWAELGLKPKHISSFPKNELSTNAELKMPIGHGGPIFLAYPNFKIIMRWNKLELYALSVGLLADSISEKAPCPPHDPDAKSLRRTDVVCMQDKLRECGHFKYGSDGLIGSKTRKAIRQFQRENNFVPDGYPTQEMLVQMECYHE